jgi:PAS domain S-box-containing protein
MAATESNVLDPIAQTHRDVVLCVDDDPSVLSSLRRLLRGEPYELETVENPQLALERIEKGGISLVLVDQRMPQMCGSDFAERVQRMSPATLRVMLTAYPGNVFVHHGLSDAIQWMMSKPWNDEALKLTLRQLLRDRAKNVPMSPPSHAPAARRDLSDGEATGLHLSVEHQVAEILAESVSVPEACARIVETVARGLGWAIGLLWRPDVAADGLRMTDWWSAPGVDASELETLSRERVLHARDELGGRVRVGGRPLWITDLRESGNHPRLNAAVRAGLHSACASPVLLDGEMLGVLEFMGRESRPPDLGMLTMLEDVGRQLAQFIERRCAQDERDSFFSLSLDLLAVMGTDGYLKRVSPSWERTLGWTSEELLSRPCLEFVHPDDREITAAEAGKLAAGQDAIRFENRYRAKDGSYRWLSWTCPAPRRPEGLVFAVARDVTEQRQAIENLRLSEERYRALVDSAVDIVSTVSRDGRITSLNPAFETLTGWTRSRWLGQSFEPLVHPDDLPAIRSVLSGIWNGESAPAIECRILTRAGSYLTMESTLRSQTAGGDIVGALAITRDVTRRKEAERERDRLSGQLLQGQKLQALGQLSAGIAHEINNPIGFILSNLNTIDQYAADLVRLLAALRGDATREQLDRLWSEIDGDFLLEDFRKAIDESRHGAERIRDIVRSLREFSHVDENELRDTSLEECMEAGLRLCANEVKHKAVVERRYDRIPPIKAYPQRLVQVFVNLLVNAAQAIGQSGRITLTTRVEAGWAVASVQDNGSGIPSENLERIFEPFFTTKPVGKGTGLGLHVAYKIIRAHGGRIDVRSNLGEGTEFVVRLPLDRSGKAENGEDRGR